MNIRFGSEADLPEIRKLVTLCRLSTDNLQQDKPRLVTETDGLVVATMALPRRGNRVHIQSLSVHPDYRRQGLARDLIDFGFDTLDLGDQLAALTLFWNNAFYLRIGFTKVDAAEMKRADDIGRRPKHKYCTAFIRTKN